MSAAVTLLKKPKFAVKLLAIASLAVALSSVAWTAVAVENATSGNTSPECTAFRSAAQVAMSNQLSIVDTFMSGANSQMQAAVSKNNSCIGNLALLDFDLSKLIPDFGLLGTLLSSLVDKIVTGVINKACAAVSDVISKPAAIWNNAVGAVNLNGQFQDWATGVNYKIPGVIDNVGGGGSSGSGSSGTPVVDTSIPVTCTETVAGKVCTDGSTSGTGVSADTPSGAQIGGQFAAMLRACSDALDADAAAGAGRTRETTLTCIAAQNFIVQYAPYLDPASVPKLPGFTFDLPPGIGTIACAGGLCKPGNPNEVGAPTFEDGMKSKSSASASTKSNFSLPVRK